jgi:hypothetical protein
VAGYDSEEDRLGEEESIMVSERVANRSARSWRAIWAVLGNPCHRLAKMTGSSMFPQLRQRE